MMKHIIIDPLPSWVLWLIAAWVVVRGAYGMYVSRHLEAGVTHDPWPPHLGRYLVSDEINRRAAAGDRLAKAVNMTDWLSYAAFLALIVDLAAIG